MLTITTEAAQNAVRQAIKMFGEDYTYAQPGVENLTCMYGFDVGRPGCLVGWMLWLIDAPTFEMVRETYNYTSVDNLARMGAFAFESDELLFAVQSLQSSQDRRDTWGEAAKQLLSLKPVH